MLINHGRIAEFGISEATGKAKKKKRNKLKPSMKARSSQMLVAENLFILCNVKPHLYIVGMWIEHRYLCPESTFVIPDGLLTKCGFL